MRLFLFFFFVFYGMMHLYAFFRIRAALEFSKSISALVLLFMLIMVLAPVIIRLSEHAGYSTFARITSYGGYTWMGILFLFVSFSVVVDFYRLIVFFGGVLFKQKLSFVSITSQQAFLLPLIVSLLIAFYGYFEARNIRTERVVVETSKIPSEVGTIRIAQISDIHLGLIVREKRLESILSKVKEAEPDILISTGDLVDGQLNNLDGFVELFEEIRPRLGKYAITGNHEFYAGLSQAIDFTRKAGFTVLRGEGRTIDGILNISGIDDITGKYYSENFLSERELLVHLPKDMFTIFLKHRPVVNKDTTGLFDLQLSGHVHKGQIFPFSIITGLYYETQSGFAKLSSRASLYVSRGSGTWGPPIRFLSAPEVTIIDLVPEGSAG